MECKTAFKGFNYILSILLLYYSSFIKRKILRAKFDKDFGQFQSCFRYFLSFIAKKNSEKEGVFYTFSSIYGK